MLQAIERGRWAILLALSVFTLAACESDTVRTITPTPGAATATPSATEVPATATAEPTETATSVPTETSIPTETTEPTATAEATETTEATIAPTFTPTPVMTGTAATFTPTPIMTGTAATETPTPAGPTPTATNLPGQPTLIGSIHQIYITDLTPDFVLALRDSEGNVINTGAADARGSFVFRNLEPGDGYTVDVSLPSATTSLGAGMVTLGPVSVLAMDEHPDPSIYEGQTLAPGYGYLRTRDGTLLAINVVFPAGVNPEDGPFPTLVEYSGYDPANPRVNQPGVLIGPLLGFATVGVNMRGTGCSGGAFDYFEAAQSTDGYDAIEVIARQSWVKGGKVGMIGISYPGISQLFTAQLQPPSLAAIAPLSVISETATTLYPGGILNNGFAVDWAADRQRDATVGGQGWSQTRMDEGDQICIDNQKLKDQATDLFQRIAENPYYVAEIADPLSPATFVENIEVPVFLAGAWQDEQTGGHFPTMLDKFTGHPNVHFTMTNGGHSDSLGPVIFSRMFEFYSLYVADEILEFPTLGAVAIAEVGRSIFGVDGIEAPPLRYTPDMSLEDARADFESDPSVRILFDNGDGSDEPGAPYPGFEMNFDAWPIPDAVATRFYFTGDGGLASEVPSDSGEVSYNYNPNLSQNISLDGGSGAAWRAQPNWHWDFVAEDDEVVFTTDALTNDTVVVGSSSVDLWLKSTAMDTDLQVTISEIRPDGYELYVQNGWLRAARRTLDEDRSTELRPVHTQLEADDAPLPDGEFVSVRVEMFPFGHAFRAGSKIRVAVGSPGESRVLWKYDVLEEDGDVVNSIGYGTMYPSSVVLPVIDGATIPTDYPAATSYRAQPARSIDVATDS